MQNKINYFSQSLTFQDRFNDFMGVFCLFVIFNGSLFVTIQHNTKFLSTVEYINYSQYLVWDNFNSFFFFTFTDSCKTKTEFKKILAL